MPAKRTTKPRTTRRRSGDHVVVAPKGRRDAVLDVIGAARKRLILSVFRCDDFAILDGLADALRRKVRVEVLLTPRAKGWEKRLKDLWDVLEGMGATLHRYSDPVVKYHAKYIVADNGPALVASLNLTRKCLTGTVDFIVTTRNRGVVSGLTRLFDADRASSGGPLPRGLSPRLIIGPERARQQFTDLIQQAKRSIRLIDPKVTDPGIVGLLKARKAAGVKVTILGRGSIGGLATHGKLLIIDGKIAVIGSVSLSALSLDFRREVAIIVTDRDAVDTLNTFFQHHAAGGRRRARAS
jgi:cardiolipin synthase